MHSFFTGDTVHPLLPQAYIEFSKQEKLMPSYLMQSSSVSQPSIALDKKSSAIVIFMIKVINRAISYQINHFCLRLSSRMRCNTWSSTSIWPPPACCMLSMMAR